MSPSAYTFNYSSVVWNIIINSLLHFFYHFTFLFILKFFLKNLQIMEVKAIFLNKTKKNILNWNQFKNTRIFKKPQIFFFSVVIKKYAKIYSIEYYINTNLSKNLTQPSKRMYRISNIILIVICLKIVLIEK